MKAIKDNATYLEKIIKQDDGYKASAKVNFTKNPSDGNYIKFNGTKFTFRDKPQAENDVQIGSTIEETVANLLQEPNLPNDVTYTQNGTEIFIEYKTVGSEGNNWTIESDFLSVPESLSGGSDTPDPDFAKVTDTTINYKPEEIHLLDDTTSTALVTYTEVSENEDVLLIENDDSIVETKLGSVTTEETDSTQILDIFGDGSCIATYTFDDENANDLSGNYNGTWSGTEAYEDGKFGKAAVFNNSTSNNIKIPKISLKNEFTINLWMDINKNTSSNCRFLSSNTDGRFYLTADPNDEDGIGFRSDSVELHSGNIDISDGYHMITYIADSNGIRILLDTNEVASTDSTCSLYNIEQLNSDAGDDKWPVYGIDQVRIFNRSLTEEEVNQLYNEQATKYTADISSADVSEAPVKAFRKQSPSVSIAVAKSFVSKDTTQTLDIFNDNSCIACYTFDGENANDLGDKYNGAWNGAEQYDTGVFGGKAAKFDGSSYIDTGYKTTDLIDNKSFSLWIKADPSANSEYVEFFGYRDANNRSSLSLFWNNKDNCLDLVSSGGTDYKYVKYNGFNDVVKDWTHICGVYEDGKQTLYVNGVKIGTESLGQDGNTEYNILIGWAKSNDKLNGLIDQIRIFNKTLTENEVKQLYNEQREYIEDSNFVELEPKSVSYKEDKFTAVFSDLEKEGRYIQRKIVSPNKGLEIIEPFTSNLWKKG